MIVEMYTPFQGPDPESEDHAAECPVASRPIEFLYNVSAVVLLAIASKGFAPHGVALSQAVVLHAMMIILCVAYLRRSSLLY